MKNYKKIRSKKQNTLYFIIQIDGISLSLSFMSLEIRAKHELKKIRSLILHFFHSKKAKISR